MILVFLLLGFLIGLLITTIFWLYVAYIKMPKLSKAFKKFLEDYKEQEYDFWNSENQF